MDRDSRTSWDSQTARSAIATLEFVMALPVLLLLMIAITWLGFSVIGQTEVLVEARNKVWSERFKDAAKNPLSFPILPEHDAPFLPKYKKAADYVTEVSSKQVEVSPIFSKIPGPTATATVLAGSWDSEAMPMDTPPNFILMGKAALIGSIGSVLDIASVVSDPLGLAKKFLNAKRSGKNVQNEIQSGSSNVGKDDLPAGSDDGTDGGGTGAGTGGVTPEQAKQNSEKQLEEERERVRTRFRELGAKVDYSNRVTPVTGELEAAQDAQIQAQFDSKTKSDAAINENDPERKKQLQEEAARAHRKVELTRITYERLEAECLDIVREAEALGMSRVQLNLMFGL